MPDEPPMTPPTFWDGGAEPDEIEAAIGPSPPPPEPARVVGLDGKPVRHAGSAPVEAVPLPIREIAEIPPRPWAYGTFLLFGQAAALGAVDGGGKGALAVGIALAFITGQPLLGERVWQPGPVAILTYEDDATEWERRIAAACLFHGLEYADVRGQVFFISAGTRRIRIAALQDGRTAFPDGDGIVAAVRQFGCKLLLIDPFNHAHDMQDGNSNALIAQVASEITRIAQEGGVAALVLHHLRKGSNGAADDLMGATSLRATFRAARILQRMDREIAERLGVEESWRYTRIAGSKENYAPPPEDGTWFRLASQDLGNPSALYPAGDNVAVAVPWTPPTPFDGLTWIAIDAILDQIERGPAPGERYAPARQAKERWVGQPFLDAGRSAGQAVGIIKAWIENGVLEPGLYHSPERRREVACLGVNRTKAAEMRRAMQDETPVE